MNIRISVIELNARRNGEAFVNGVQVDLLDVRMCGSESQIRWGCDILRRAVTEIVQIKLRQEKLDGVCAGEDLDACVEVCNRFFAGLAPRLDDMPASLWIDRQHLSARSLLAAMAEE